MEEFEILTHDNAYLYILGFLTFCTTILDDWINPKRKFKKFAWYLQEFVYTLIAIILGIGGCYALNCGESTTLVVSIFMGLIGSTFVRRIRTGKDKISDDLLTSILNRTKTKIKDKEKTEDN